MMPCRGTSKAAGGFTLVEMLVVVGIIGILGALVMGGASAAIKQARKAQEMGAARKLISAYVAAADPDSGQLPGGYDRTVDSVTGPGGVSLSGPTAERYPWRLLSYLGGDVPGSVLVGDVARQISATDTYLVSCYPAFGINYIFVGGDIQTDGSMSYANECITRMANSAPVLVFASACASGSTGSSSGNKIDGYCILTPPNLTGSMWNSSAWTSKSAPSDYGNVDGRYDGKAVCAFLDGSVRLTSIEELRDMRLWSRGAAQAGDENYTIADTTPRGGRL